MTTLTNNERAFLKLIIESEYQDGSDPVDCAVWTFYICENFGGTRKASGVTSSLVQKGLIKTTGNADPAKGSGGEIWITQAGFDAYNGVAA